MGLAGVGPSVATGPLQMLPGLSNQALQLFFLLVALVVFLWGFERYRTTFSKVELLISVAVSVGLLTIGVFPSVIGSVADLLNLESRALTVSILGNTAFVFILLYLVTMINGNRRALNELSRNLVVEDAGERSDRGGIFVVIPAYNESDTVGTVVDSLPESMHGHDVTPVVVSDGSTDETKAAADGDDRIVVEHFVNQGQGGAIKTGFEIALSHGADVIVTMDADGQHPVSELAALVEPIVAGTAEYVIGSRYLGADRTGNSMTRRTGIRFFTAIINLLSKAGVTDCTSGYRAIRADALESMTLTEERFSAPELIIESRKQGLRITEVPVTMRERGEGETKKPKLGYAVGLARTIFVTWIR